MTALKLITPPSVEPLTLAEVKLHLRVDHDHEDAEIERCAKAARQWIDGFEGFLGRALIDQTWDFYMDAFPTSNEIRIPLPPLLEVMSVNYFDGDGVETTMSSAEYTVDDVNEPGWVVLNQSSSWPSTLDAINAVRIRFRAGYVDTSVSPYVGEVPADILQAMLLYTGTMYENRETIVIGQSAVNLPWSAEQLLHRRRKDMSFA